MSVHRSQQRTRESGIGHKNTRGTGDRRPVPRGESSHQGGIQGPSASGDDFYSKCCRVDPSSPSRRDERFSIRSTADAVRFFRSMKSFPPNQVIRNIRVLPGGKIAMNKAINGLNYDHAEDWKTLTEVISQFVHKDVFFGLNKDEVIIILSWLVENELFLGKLVTGLRNNLIVDVRTISLMIGSVVASFPNTNKSDNNLLVSVFTILIQIADSHCKILLKNAFGMNEASTTIDNSAGTTDSQVLWEPLHDNDFPDNYRDVQIYPTSNELNIEAMAMSLYYRGWRGQVDAEDTKLLDRQFRLLRTDMISSLRDEITDWKNSKKSDWQFLHPVALKMVLGDRSGRDMVIDVKFPLPEKIKQLILKNKDDFSTVNKLTKYFQTDGERLLAINSTIVFFADNGANTVVAIGTVASREAEKMAKQVFDSKDGQSFVEVGLEFRSFSLPYAMLHLQAQDPDSSASDMEPMAAMALQLRSAFFSYEPVLKALQDMVTIPLREELLLLPPSVQVDERPINIPASVSNVLESDKSQKFALEMALRQRVTLVQGPPGTGKTFLGVQIVKTLLTDPNMTILCVCYTNHALDSFLESLIDSRIDPSKIVRLGNKGKISDKVRQGCTINLRDSNFSSEQSSAYGALKRCLEDLKEEIQGFLDSKHFQARNGRFGESDWKQVTSFLSFMDGEEEESDEHFQYWVQLTVPANILEGIAGYKVVGQHGRALQADSYWQRWISGLSRPREMNRNANFDIWSMNIEERRALNEKWYTDNREFRIILPLIDLLKVYSERLLQLKRLQEESKLSILQTAKIVACTTTYASINKKLLDSGHFRVVLVEEAAEILESHVLVNISQSTEKLVMIGDHKQLRPKLQYYPLTVDSKKGIDFDRSLFERLILSGYPAATLTVQHRMRPEISRYIRHTYPDLLDHERTLGRDNIRGTFKNVAFINHHHFENHDGNDVLSLANSSKKNDFEVRMTLRMVRYLLQQGYQLNDIVILTPYLGQLLHFRKTIRHTTFPNIGKLHIALSTLDRQDLENSIRYGTEEDSGTEDSSDEEGEQSQSLRVATIDNFQGEEAKIILVSLVRANPRGDIGFVRGPERANVLFSRARDGFYILGHADTLRNASNPEGRQLWNFLLDQLHRQDCLLDGFPAYCPLHDKRQLLDSPEAFDAKAMDGGCEVHCGFVLPTCAHGHVCPKMCHPHFGKTSAFIHQHDQCQELMREDCQRHMHTVQRVCSAASAQPCHAKMSATCNLGHIYMHDCCRNAPICNVCEKARRAAQELEKKFAKEMESLSKQLETLELENHHVQNQAKLAKKRAEIETRRDILIENMEAAKEKIEKEKARLPRSSEAKKVTKASNPQKPAVLQTSVAAETENNQIDDPSKKSASRKNNRSVSDHATKDAAIAAVDSVAKDANAFTSTAEDNKRTVTTQSTPTAVATEEFVYIPANKAPVIKTLFSLHVLLQFVKDERWEEVRKALPEEIHDLSCFCPQVIHAYPQGYFLVRLLTAITSHEISDDQSRTFLRMLPDPDDGNSNVEAREKSATDLLFAYTRFIVYAKFEECQSLRDKFAEKFLELCEGSKSELFLRWKNEVADFLRPPTLDRELASSKYSSPNMSPVELATEKKLKDITQIWKDEKSTWLANQKQGRVSSSAASGRVSSDKKSKQAQSPSPAMDALLEMTGLLSIKAKFLEVYQKLQLKKEQGISFDGENLNTCFLGNPGTGKTTVANLFCSFLQQVGVLPDTSIVLEKTGAELANGGMSAFQSALGKVKEAKGGVVFIDEAYQLKTHSSGQIILDFLLKHTERMTGEYGSVVWIIAGYKKNMEDLLEYNMGLPSRFPYKFEFDDYSERELISIFQDLMKRGGQSSAKIDTDNNNNSNASVKTAAAPVVLIPRGLPSTYTAYNQYYANKPDEVDQWGNTWRWDANQSCFVDDYNNITGYGANSLGSVANPIVSRSTNIAWCYDNASKTWYNQNNSAEKLDHYPGKPVVAAPKKPAVCEFTVRDDKFVRIAIRRLARLAGTTGFGNARAVRNLFQLSCDRMTVRVSEERRLGMNPNIYLFERDDLLGPLASRAVLSSSAAWKQLQALEGLPEVKRSIEDLVDLVIRNAMREETEEKLLAVTLNRVFLGNPGTGKTTVAKLYAEILRDLGLLSKGECIYRKASDFVGNALGRSEETTRAILHSAMGSVLVIDEAYGLYQETGNGNEPYREAVINTIVENVQGVPGEDRAVILIGYKEEMQLMFAHTNPGLARRFQLDEAFQFSDYDDEALVRILMKAVKADDLQITRNTAMFAVKQLAKARAGPHFGNAGAVNNLLSSAKLRYSQRLSSRSSRSHGDTSGWIEQDFVPENWTDEVIDPQALLAGLVGCGDIREKLSGYCDIAAYNRSQGFNVKDGMHFSYVFMGPPGTGKTSIARLMGKMFHSLGLIPTDECVEVSASKFITGFVGQAGKQTRDIFQQARGKVLFVDEAYRLNPNHGGSFMKEVVDEIVNLLTEEGFKDNMIVIFAGYEQEMQEMLSVNAGLQSRFTEYIRFEPFSPDAIAQMIYKILGKEFDPRLLLPAASESDKVTFQSEFIQWCRQVSEIPNFANGRDVTNLLKTAKLSAIKRSKATNSKLVYTLADFHAAKAELMKNRPNATTTGSSTTNNSGYIVPNLPQAFQDQTMSAPVVARTTTAMTTSTAVAAAVDTQEEEEELSEVDYEEPTAVAATEELPIPDIWNANNNAALYSELQALLEEFGMNNKQNIQRLATLPINHPEIQELLQQLMHRLHKSYDEIATMLETWFAGQKNVKENLEQQEQKEKEARKQGLTEMLVPIWRCGVCGRADMPYIACYVQPFIVRYEKRPCKAVAK